MLQGKVKQALASSVMRSRETLQAKHLEAARVDESVLLNGNVSRVQELTFEGIDVQFIQFTDKQTLGSAKPINKGDAGCWKHILYLKAYGKLSDELAEDIVLITRRQCVEKVHTSILIYYSTAAWLYCERQKMIIVGKSVAKFTSNDIQLAEGALESCTGIGGGIEAAIHGEMRHARLFY